MGPDPQELEPPANPVRFNAAKQAGRDIGQPQPSRLGILVRMGAVIRQARAAARAYNKELTLAALRQVFQMNHPPEIERRVALHECGHAIACKILEIGPVKRVMIDRDGGGGVSFDAIPKHGTAADLRARLIQLMAGRAAEHLVLGSISAGAGGGAESDLAKATTLATAIHTQYGLGIHGSAWLGGSDASLLRDPTLLSCVRREVLQAEKRARQILGPHLVLLGEMASALVQCRDMDGAEAAHWLGQVGPTVTSSGQQAVARDVDAPGA